MNRLTLSFIIAGALSSAPAVCAQQTMITYNPLRGCQVQLENGENQTLEYINDGNDLTTFKAETASDVAILFTLQDACTVKGINIVAGEDAGKAPTQLKLYGRNSADESWTTVVSLPRSVKYTSAFCPYSYPALANTLPYREYKLDITGAQNSTALEIAELELLALPETDNNLATAQNGTFTASSPAGDLAAADGSDPATGVTFRNVRAADGVENAWLQYDFDTPTAIASYSITTNASAAAATRPTAWELMASEDGETWNTLDIRSNETSFNSSNYQIRRNIGEDPFKIDFAAVSDNLHSLIIDKFFASWGSGKYLITGWNSDASKIDRNYNYWWMAHAVDAYVDAYIRTGSRIYQSRAIQIRQGMYTAYDAGRQDLWNSYFDDMEWMNLACIRAYENLGAGNDQWLAEAKQLFDWIWEGWNYDNGSEGGIRWNSGSGTGKNSCSNAPAIVGAAKLYQITGEQEYLDKAIMIYEWMLTHSRFEDGFIKDAPDNDNRGWVFSYNQGTWVGGLLELYRITGEQKYYDVAVDLMDKSLFGKWFSPDGIMRESGDGDGGLFKGIYIRYITNWVLSGYLDPERQYRYAQYLVENARSLYNCALHKDIWKIIPDWKTRPETSEGSYHSSILLSGLFLCESVDMLRRAGLLDDNYNVKNPAAGKAYSHYRMVFTDNRRNSNLQIGGFGLYAEKQASAIAPEAASTAVRINAANGMIDITGAAPQAAVTIYSIDGRTIASTTVSACPINLASGLYIVHVEGDGASAATTAKVAL